MRNARIGQNKFISMNRLTRNCGFKIIVNNLIKIYIQWQLCLQCWCKAYHAKRLVSLFLDEFEIKDILKHFFPYKCFTRLEHVNAIVSTTVLSAMRVSWFQCILLYLHIWSNLASPYAGHIINKSKFPDRMIFC